jgi:DNA-binding CsgD family transcriptional regulator
MTSQVIAMRKAGRPNVDIAAKLDVSLRSLEVQIGRLIREGVISSRKGLLWSHPDSWVEGRGRTREDVAGKVERLYKQGKTRKQIAKRLELTPAQVSGIFTALFAAGLPKRAPHQLTDTLVRAIHAQYLSGDAINERAAEAGFSGAAVRKRMHKLGLPIDRGSSR